MALLFPNRTSQAGTYKTGTPNYVDVSTGAAIAGMVTFDAKATDDSWADGDTIGVLVSKDNSNYWVGVGTWDSTNSYVELTTEEESVGTLSDTDSVTISAVLTGNVVTQVRGREILTADRTYYVATTGSDSNDGLSAGSPFLTIQRAIDVVCGSIDLESRQVTVQVADGTYTDPVILSDYVGKNAPILQGNTTTPANVLVSVTSNNAISITTSANWKFKGFKLQTTTTGSCLAVSAGNIDVSLVEFGVSASSHIYVSRGGSVFASGNYSISGSAYAHIRTTDAATVVKSTITVTLSGTPAFTYFVESFANSAVTAYNITYSGGATGQRYTAYLGGIINTYAAGSNYFPGSTAGATATGGQYE